MKSFWLALLQKAIQALLSKEWGVILNEVESLIMDRDVSGAEKRERVFVLLRAYGSQAATWLLYAGIEIAYGTLKSNGN